MMNAINSIQMIQQLKANPAAILRRAGLNIPHNMSNPNDIIQHLMNSGQVTQDAYNRAQQMAQQLKNI